ncbi:MAG: hypothetical protein HXS46_12795 [Theionarchaea archaeon]|nr:MAG: hypothetical protein AYK18_10695 [Theionarchaea archaeon DG-70]MBU7011560.1 hypothetical protein [Theionarchaea archaeon]
MNCYYHPDRASVAQCVVCGKNLCSECNIIKEGQSYCRECLGRTDVSIGTRKILLPALGCGILTAILSVVLPAGIMIVTPMPSVAGCGCCAGVVLAGGLAVFLVKHLYGVKGKISMTTAALTGGLSGFTGSVIIVGLLILLLGGLSSVTEDVADMPEIQEALEEAGITAEAGEWSGLVLASFILVFAFMIALYSVFGAVGGIVTNELTK